MISAKIVEQLTQRVLDQVTERTMEPMIQRLDRIIELLEAQAK